MPSYHVHFMMSTGLAEPITVPKGTHEQCVHHVKRIEELLGYKVVQYRDNPPHWKTTAPLDCISDWVFCDIALTHNTWVRCLYDNLAEWSQNPPAEPTEVLTPDKAQDFWHGLRIIDVPVHRWTEEYYRNRMEHLYEVMRGRASEGVRFEEDPLTPKQAAAVIQLFEFIDPTGEQDMEVPRGQDRILTSDEYFWCETHGAVEWEEAEVCISGECDDGE